jgi:branched-chain amino acid transport system permease protein
VTPELFFGLLPITIADGLSLGLVYAVIALGYTMVYGVLEFINFAHSEIFMVGGVVGVELIIWLERVTRLPATGGALTYSVHPLLQLVIAVIFAAAVAGAVAVAVERVAYRPLRLRGAPKLVPLISAIGMSLFLIDVTRFIESLFGQFNRPFPNYAFFDTQIPFFNVTISFKVVVVLAVVLLMLGGLIYLINFTNTGRAIRAVSQDQSTSALMGINVSQIITITFLIGGALGGVAGVLYALKFSSVNPYVGFIPGLKSFTAAVLGGIGSIPGAMLGGVLLGLLETLAGTYIPIATNGAVGTEYKDIVAFGVLILILIFKPSGLLGKAVSEKV